MIRLEHVSKRFETGKHTVEAVRDVSLHIEKGKIAGIIGFSGAGKSTLARCINLLERPTQGKVIVGGAELTALNEKQLREKRKKIGMIFQHFNLFASRTVYGNVAYPLKGSGRSRGEIDQKVRSLLDLVGLADKADAYPSQLSGGQKQRVAIARALANDPEVLLSDEATSALDPDTTRSILRLLKEVNRTLGITIVIITHEMGVIKEICDQVYVMEGGQVVEQGDVFHVFASPQRAVTRKFVDSTSNLSRIRELLDDPANPIQLLPGDYLLRLNYLERSTSQALISTLSRQFDLDINILLGNIELIDGNPLGGLVVIAGGGHDRVTAAAEYLSERNVLVEVIAHG
ncbi:methionine ABC transporter ATP-binding protein [Flintibacter muris]|uniref:methionine ABC transporter ATP-binding protein n=1 Tax=Flintibacter muris TaxID=2941327 RepID=UPI00203A5706|nr:methionine ABC transporter ATP-binding protein [Flintibacter muris]